MMIGHHIGIGTNAGTYSPAGLAPLFWFRADHPSNSYGGGGGHETLVNAGSVGGVLEQTGLETLQPAYPLDFDAAQSQVLIAATSADWTPLHDGTAYTMALRFRSDETGTTQRILENATNLSTQRGIRLHRTSTNLMQFQMLNASGSRVFIETAGAPGLDWATYTVRIQPNGSGGVAYDLRLNGTSVASGDTGTTAPSAVGPGFAMRFGGNVNYFDGRAPELVVAPGYLSDSATAQLEFYLRRWS